MLSIKLIFLIIVLVAVIIVFIFAEFISAVFFIITSAISLFGITIE